MGWSEWMGTLGARDVPGGPSEHFRGLESLGDQVSISVPACLGDPVSVSGGWRVCGPEQRSRSLVFMKRPCIAPSIHSPDNYLLSASVLILTHRCVQGHTEPPPLSHCGPMEAEPELTGTRPTCSPEWTENAEGVADPQEEVPRGAEAIGVCKCTRLAPWGAFRGPKPGWHYCQALLNLHLETRQLGLIDNEKRVGDPHLCTWETGECLASTGLVSTGDGLFLPSQ